MRAGEVLRKSRLLLSGGRVRMGLGVVDVV